jgi:hypothetical protein
MTDASDGKRDFFVSFNQADRAWATWIAWVLEEKGYSVWFQDWDFQGNFVLEMNRAHQQSRRTLAVLSPDYLASCFTAPEWAARFREDAGSKHDLLIPVRVREYEPSGLLGSIAYVDLVGLARDQARRQLLNRVAGIRLKPDEEPFYPGRPPPAAVRSIPSEPRFPKPETGSNRRLLVFCGALLGLAGLVAGFFMVVSGNYQTESGSEGIKTPRDGASVHKGMVITIPGDKTLAEWTPGCLYEVRAQKESNGTLRACFGFDPNECFIAAGALQQTTEGDNLKLGTPVFVYQPICNCWAAGTLLRFSGSRRQSHVELDTGLACVTSSTLWVDTAAVIALQKAD